MVATDANFVVIMLLEDGASVPVHPDTKKPVTRVKDRVEHWIQTLEKDGEKVLIPTPALSEILTLAGDPETASNILSDLSGQWVFEVGPFDQVSAVEAAIQTIHAMNAGNKRGKSLATWAKVKFDRQIVAIAKTKGVTAVYSNDSDIHRSCKQENIPCFGVWDLPDPPAKQDNLKFPEPEEQ
jgi:predicted nucleic acid-binding protein